MAKTETQEKRFIPVSEYCRRSAWEIDPARLRYWCRFGCQGEPIPHRKLGTRYYIDAPAMELWLNSRTRGKQTHEEEAAEIMARIYARQEGRKE